MNTADTVHSSDAAVFSQETVSPILDRALSGEKISLSAMETLLSLTDTSSLHEFFQTAYRVKKEAVGNQVYFRGIIECSNVCCKDCYYCGIRRSNIHVERYSMDPEEMYREAMLADEYNYASIVIQAGERQDADFISMIEKLLIRIKKDTRGRLGITLSLGEQSRETCERWFAAGAHRYLLRIETANPNLYRQLHPSDHSFEQRKQALLMLKECGYQVGSGIMIGLPGQSVRHLAEAVRFFQKMDLDMIGMGPWIPHRETPLGKNAAILDREMKGKLLTEALKMIALTRLVLKDVNIAATTALQALAPDGREQGLLAGANVIMPNLTETEFRPAYTLYEDKPCTDENSGMCRGCLERRIASIGESVAYGEWGDAPHYQRRISADRAF